MRLLEGVIAGIFIGWLLSLFNFDDAFVGSIKEIFNLAISSDTYYMVFALVGLLGGVIHK